MITLYHCTAARSFRPLWALEELRLPYDLKMLPFPPQVLARDYLALNPLVWRVQKSASLMPRVRHADFCTKSTLDQ